MAKTPLDKIPTSNSEAPSGKSSKRTTKGATRKASKTKAVAEIDSDESEPDAAGTPLKRESVGHRDKCWTEYAVTLRKRMFLEGKYELTLASEEVKRNSGTDSKMSDLRNPKYWKAVRDAKTGWDTLSKNGVEVDFDVADDGLVHSLVFRLDETWSGVLERALKRK